MSGRSIGESDWRAKELFSTGEAAVICQVSQQTIIRCFDSGKLQGFRVPGSRFRRIPRAELIRFMRRNRIPTITLESPIRRILIVDDDPRIVALIRSSLERDDRFEVRTAATGYDAGLLTQQFRPHLILLDLRLPDIDGAAICRRVKADPDLRGTKVIIISGALGRREIQSLVKHGADGFVRKPIDLARLKQEIALMV